MTGLVCHQTRSESSSGHSSTPCGRPGIFLPLLTPSNYAGPALTRKHVLVAPWEP